MYLKNGIQAANGDKAIDQECQTDDLTPENTEILWEQVITLVVQKN